VFQENGEQGKDVSAALRRVIAEQEFATICV